MVTNEENDQDDSDRSSSSSERSASRSYSAGQSRPTSRGRPGSDDDEDEDADTVQDGETIPDESDEDDTVQDTTSEKDEVEDATTGETPTGESKSPEPNEMSGDSSTTSETDSQTGPSAGDVRTEEQQVDGGDDDVETEATDGTGGVDAPGPSPDDTVNTETSPDSESGMYDELDEYRGFSIFDGLGPEAIETIVEGSRTVTLRSGETLFEEGDSPNGCFYLILEGDIKIMKFMRTETTQVTRLEEGDYFGEFGMFTGNDRMAGIEARTNSELLEIPKESLEKLRANDAEDLAMIYENMFEVLAKRFKAMAKKAEKSQFWL